MRSRSEHSPRGGGSTLRIVGGTLRGSRLVVADADGLRPTSDRIRETLFNWLAPVIEGARCLDLFAGTGALGIEAMSRGAGECVFVERDRTLVQLLTENLARLKVTDASVANADALGWLTIDSSTFDVVFLDPPFSTDLWTPAAQRLEDGGWLHADAWIYVETPALGIPQLPANWHEHRVGHAGNVRYALYRRVQRDPLS